MNRSEMYDVITRMIIARFETIMMERLVRREVIVDDIFQSINPQLQRMYQYGTFRHPPTLITHFNINQIIDIYIHQMGKQYDLNKMRGLNEVERAFSEVESMRAQYRAFVPPTIIKY